MKSSTTVQVYIPIVTTLAQDLGEQCDVDVSKDLKRLEERILAEGMPFLTEVMPTLSSSLEAGLASGHLEPIQGFRPLKDKAVPRFLAGFWLKVFFGESGRLREDACPLAIRAIRQLARLFKKIELECPEAAVTEALDQYIRTDEELGQLDVHAIECGFLNRYQRIADMLWTHVLLSVDESVANCTLLPRHGGGATADRLFGNAKYNADWFGCLEAFFPSDSYRVPDMGYNSLHTYKVLEEAPIVNVTTVPKVPSKPRIIALEPAAMQYAQQAVMTNLYAAVEMHPIRDVIGFRDQTRNQRMAHAGSVDGSLATIDLSEASDRVHPFFVNMMFRLLPNLRGAAFACRSPFARVPGRGVIKLEKFSSMGSALCFPLESMHFLTVVACSTVDVDTMTIESILEGLRDVSVFGDDIVVPTAIACEVTANLEAVGLKVNQEKSFLSGRFRESCGTDFYAGVPVTSVYVRKELPLSTLDADSLLAWVDTTNQLAGMGYDRTSNLLRSYIEHIVGPLPHNAAEGLTWVGAIEPESEGVKSRFDRRLQRSVKKTWVASPRVVDDQLDGYAALMKSLLALERVPEATTGLLNDVGLAPTELGHGRKTRHEVNMETVAMYARRVGGRSFDLTVKPYSTRLRQRWVGLED